jgi:hypothetical protein
VYLTDTILRIDPATGSVTANIDASGLLTASERRSAKQLNGIAGRTRNRQVFDHWQTLAPHVPGHLRPQMSLPRRPPDHQPGFHMDSELR